MKNITFLIASGTPERFSYLMATLGCLLPNIKNAQVIVAFHYDILQFLDKSQQLEILRDLCIQRKIDFKYTSFSKEISLAAMKSSVIREIKDVRKWIWFLDDDVMFSAKTLKRCYQQAMALEQMSDYFVFEFVDVNNRREHKDWDLVKYYPYQTSMLPLEKIIHHRWYPFTTRIDFGGSIFLIKKEALYNGALEEMDDFPVGERGYDVAVAEEFEDKIAILGHTFWHVGMDSDFFNAQWAKINHNVADLLEDKKSQRLPK